jgi:DNA-binding IclR family transcriptional regulator
MARAKVRTVPADLIPALDRIRAKRFELHESRDFEGITDICCPIIGENGSAVAAIIVACVKRYGRETHAEDASMKLIGICREIGEAIGARRSVAKATASATDSSRL